MTGSAARAIETGNAGCESNRSACTPTCLPSEMSSPLAPRCAGSALCSENAHTESARLLRLPLQAPVM
jgi:hypothetical protein